MIPVPKQPEPENFAETVTKKADAFLKKKNSPTGKEIHNRPYWRNALDDLYKAYNKVCAYSALWFPRDAVTVDHYIPISVIAQSNPGLAYDWNNFRLASRSMNTEKGKFQDVLDPFLIEPGWFAMEFPSLIIKSGSDLSPGCRGKVEATIKRLKLNEKEKYIEYRHEILWDYCLLCSEYDNIDPIFNHLEKRAPFIAYELKRQGLTKEIVYMMKYP
ncbi:MAG: hypothetical protein GTO45_12915 [Candidatus Aminicenantes bacterium]|nr:hypothetical protein [Candidatus Aminicenantes bacterium]NIM79686.1 hypothetical protein [Candidatus Aminicenantes bacterium]NIN19012.1 hypothetical protein [Candidatus Aminicenantes bacterium]NIN42914.1 hypothetical protein [Candidatus Aminicenantes bacterium]NIN85651.1 hypothetical protein [Candidatus Aminicenantes bacterium]